MNPENIKYKRDFILLKDEPKFKEQEEISHIQNELKEISKFEIKNGVSNKTKFIDIKHDDLINFKDENILSFFKSINFIL